MKSKLRDSLAQCRATIARIKEAGIEAPHRELLQRAEHIGEMAAFVRTLPPWAVGALTIFNALRNPRSPETQATSVAIALVAVEQDIARRQLLNVMRQWARQVSP
jgi:hypothetical protein